MKKRFISVVLALAMIMALLSSSTLITSAAGAHIWFSYDSLSSPFVAGEKFAGSSDLNTGYWECSDRAIFDIYSTGPNQNSRYDCKFITKKAGVAKLSMNYYDDYIMTIEVLNPVANVPVDTEYTVTGSKGTEHKWSVHSPNKNNGQRDEQRGLATLSSSNENTATVKVTSVGNIILDHQYIPDGAKDVKTECIAIKGVKGKPACTPPVSVDTVDGQILEYILLPQPDSNGKWEWDTDKNPLSTEISVNGVTSAVAKFVPNNTKDYDTVSANVEFVIDVEDDDSVADTITYYTYDASAKKMVTEKLKTQDAEMLSSSDDATTLGKAGEATWYFTPKNAIYNAKVTIVGDVNIVLTDGSSAVFTRGIKGDASSSLTLYATSLGENQGAFVVSTLDGKNGTHNYDAGGWSSPGSGADNAIDLGSLTINGGFVSALPGNGGFGGAGGSIALGRGAYASSPAYDGCAGGSALVLNNLTINAGSLKAIGGNGGAGGGSNAGTRYPANGGNGGAGVSIKNGGSFVINATDDYTGTIYIASGLGGVGGQRWDCQGASGQSPAAVNVAIDFSNKGLSVFSSDDEITVDENGAISGTKLEPDKLDEVTKHRFLLVNNDTSDEKDAAANKSDNNKGDNVTGTMISDGNPVVFIVIGVLVAAGAVAFVIIRKNKKAEVTEKVDDVVDTEDNSDNE